MASGYLLYDTGNQKPLLSDNMEGRGWGGRWEEGIRGDMCIAKADLC